MEEIKSLVEAMEAIEKIYPHLKKISTPEALVSVIATLTDTWAADHDYPDEEVQDLTRAMADIRPYVNEACGLPTKSSEEDEDE